MTIMLIAATTHIQPGRAELCVYVGELLSCSFLFKNSTRAWRQQLKSNLHITQQNVSFKEEKGEGIRNVPARQNPDTRTNSGLASTTAPRGDEIMTHGGLQRGEQVQNTRTEDSCMSVTDEECGVCEAVEKKETKRGAWGISAEGHICGIKHD